MATTTKSVTMLILGDEESAFQIPVSLKKIAASPDTSLDSASPDGNPLKQVNVDLGTGAVVEREEIRKGVFAVKPKKTDKTTWHSFKEISKDDLELIEDATQIDSFVVENFIPLKDVPLERVTEAYFLAPASGLPAKPLVLLARALKKTKRAGVFKLCKSSRQYLAVVYEKNGGLIVNTLAFSGDFSAVREAAEALDRNDARIHPAELDMAAQLVEAYAADVNVIDSFEDELVPLRADLIEKALSGKPLPKKKVRKEHAPIEDGLEDLLRRSVERAKPKRSAVPVG